jgi:hypothetical protein
MRVCVCVPARLCVYGVHHQGRPMIAGVRECCLVLILSLSRARALSLTLTLSHTLTLSLTIFEGAFIFARAKGCGLQVH